MRWNSLICRVVLVGCLVVAMVLAGGCEARTTEELQAIGGEFVTQFLRNALAAYLF